MKLIITVSLWILERYFNTAHIKTADDVPNVGPLYGYKLTKLDEGIKEITNNS